MPMFDSLKKSSFYLRPLLALAVFALACLSSGPVSAEHEADHRYIVEGYVLNAQEKPQSDVKVVVKAGEGLLGETTTNRRGFYRVRLHLHNHDLGKKLVVTAGDQETDIEVTFDPGDHQTDRVHELNFVGAGVTQADLGIRGVPTWVYVLIVIALFLVVARIVSKTVKKRRKREARLQQKQAKKKKRKPKRRK